MKTLLAMTILTLSVAAHATDCSKDFCPPNEKTPVGNTTKPQIINPLDDGKVPVGTISLDNYNRSPSSVSGEVLREDGK